MEVKVGRCIPSDPQEFALWEHDSYIVWSGWSDSFREGLVRTISSELHRLAEDPASWIPYSMRGGPNGSIELLIRLHVDEGGHEITMASAAAAVEVLADLLDED